jgi:hypothetical protein
MRKQWWSFQPIRQPTPPEVTDAKWSAHPIDRFIYSRLSDEQLPPADLAEPEILVRRLFFNLIGLPPTPAELRQWSAGLSVPAGDQRQQAFAALVDELLERPQFGERWARHWMDWIRYAESHGSEGDPEIVNAWVYRDYLIRGLNGDVPLSQLIREHIAGDLLDNPRINEHLGLNESMIGPAHWRMVFHGFAPTDALDEKVRFIDDEINTFTKAFLGMTVSCARCHDHKFDAISQEDYYAIFGVLASCRPGRKVIDTPERVARNFNQLAELKPEIREAIAKDWLQQLDSFRQRLEQASTQDQDAKTSSDLIQPLREIRQQVRLGKTFADAWNQQQEVYCQQAAGRWPAEEQNHAWDFRDSDAYSQWYREGIGLGEQPLSAGEFAIAPEGDQALIGIYPAGVYSHALSTKHAARFSSRDVPLVPDQELWAEVIGDSGATIRYVVQDYPRNGTVYPVVNLDNQWRWQRFDLSYWSGDDIHVELTTAADAPLLANNQPRSWLGVRRVLVCNKGTFSPPPAQEHLWPLFDSQSPPPKSMADLVERYVHTLTAAIQAWSNATATDEQSRWLDECLRQGWIANQLNGLPTARPLIEKYRQLEQAIPVSTRVPGLDESTGSDQPLMIRGDHKKPGDPVPRRFLEVIDDEPYQTARSGRLQLSDDLLSDDNPLTRRVLVNRVWHHLFGQGLVSTPDNFGKLGAQPSHPELLDFLAVQMAENDWSLKKTIRSILTSRTWQLSSNAPPESLQKDPENQWLSRAHVRRLEAEIIRDHLLAVSGELDVEIGGPPVAGNAPRRSVYVQVRRNALDPFLRVFDFPEPFSTVGRRDVTNVPAQSLTMLNDPRMAATAGNWAARLLEQIPPVEGDADDRQRVDRMFLTAFSRSATSSEMERALGFLRATRQQAETRQARAAELVSQIARHQRTVDELLSPVRERLRAESEAQRNRPARKQPPIAHWDFRKSTEDTIGNADAVLLGGAKLGAGGLVVGQGGYAVSQPLAHDLKAKTVEAWVQLDNLDQRNGGVVSVQTTDGVVFDAIVYAEQQPRQWMAGSNHFQRTESFGGPAEEAADQQPVHLAIVYQADGQIIGYRNGQPYGRAYRKNNPVDYRSGQTVVTFGLRHLPANPDRLLSGKIIEARIYDRALTAEEIADQSGWITEQQVLEQLSPEQRELVQDLEQRIAGLQQQLETLQPVVSVNELAVWSELSHAILTFKEFIYVR